MQLVLSRSPSVSGFPPPLSPLGNYDTSVHKPGYISEIPFLPPLTDDQKNSIFLRHVELVYESVGEVEDCDSAMIYEGKEGIRRIDEEKDDGLEENN